MKTAYFVIGILTIVAFLSAAQKHPAKDAIVMIEWSDGKHSYSNYTMTDSNGYYEMNVASGNINVSAGMGFQRGNEFLMIGNWSGNFFINGTEWRNFTLFMPQENAKIYGYVYDNSTHASIEANVSIYFEAFDKKYAGLNYTLTKNGYYEIWLPASNFSIDVAAIGYNPAFYEGSINSGEERRIDFYLDAAPIPPLTAWVSGYIKSTDGQPVSNASVELYIHNDSYNYTSINFTLTPSNGYFKFKVPAGNGGIMVNAANFFPYFGNVTAQEGMVTWVNVSLTPLPQDNAWVAGYVYDNNGNPVAGANVSVQGSITMNYFQIAYFYRYGITNEDGYFNISVPSVNLTFSPISPWIAVNKSTIDAIYARKDGYFDNSTILTPPSNVIQPGQTLSANVKLDKMPAENCTVKGYIYLVSLITPHMVYVGGTGPNNYSSIQDAINAASNGCTIKVYDGTYDGPIIIDKEIKLIGDPAIDGHGNMGIKIEANNVSIENFTIFNCSTGIYVYTYSFTITNVSIEKCIIHSCTEHGIEFKNVNDALISGNVIHNCSKHGLRVWYGENFSIANNTIFNNNWDGIFFDAYSNNNVIMQNKIHNNLNDGIEVYNSRYNSIVSNEVFNNSHNGIRLSNSMFNNISENSIHNNSDGIYFRISANNSIYSNRITGNYYGIYLFSSHNNIIYNNYFSNTVNAYDNGNNIWNISKVAGVNIIGGAWLGGNYWHDYDGYDTNGDGIGDTMLPYNCNGNILNGGDMLPLVYPINDTVPPDISNISYPSKAHAGFVNITCIVNDNVAIAGVWINITLPTGSHINESMNGNGMYYYNASFDMEGNYTFYIYAIDSNGNGNRSNEMSFTIYPSWDINMDDRINVLDLIMVAAHFGKHEGEEGYDASVDLNGDGVINVLDLIIVATHWTG